MEAYNKLKQFTLALAKRVQKNSFYPQFHSSIRYFSKQFCRRLDDLFWLNNFEILLNSEKGVFKEIHSEEF